MTRSRERELTRWARGHLEATARLYRWLGACLAATGVAIVTITLLAAPWGEEAAVLAGVGLLVGAVPGFALFAFGRRRVHHHPLIRALEAGTAAELMFVPRVWGREGVAAEVVVDGLPHRFPVPRDLIELDPEPPSDGSRSA